MLGHGALGETAIGELPAERLIDEAVSYLTRAMGLLQENGADPAVIEHCERAIKSARKANRAGAPRKPTDQLRRVQVARYFEEHGLEPTLKKYPKLSAETVLTYYRRAYPKRGQKSR